PSPTSSTSRASASGMTTAVALVRAIRTEAAPKAHLWRRGTIAHTCRARLQIRRSSDQNAHFLGWRVSRGLLLLIAVPVAGRIIRLKVRQERTQPGRESGRNLATPWHSPRWQARSGNKQFLGQTGPE